MEKVVNAKKRKRGLPNDCWVFIVEMVGKTSWSAWRELRCVDRSWLQRSRDAGWISQIVFPAAPRSVLDHLPATMREVTISVKNLDALAKFSWLRKLTVVGDSFAQLPVFNLPHLRILSSGSRAALLFEKTLEELTLRDSYFTAICLRGFDSLKKLRISTLLPLDWPTNLQWLHVTLWTGSLPSGLERLEIDAERGQSFAAIFLVTLPKMTSLRQLTIANWRGGQCVLRVPPNLTKLVLMNFHGSNIRVDGHAELDVFFDFCVHTSAICVNTARTVGIYELPGQQQTKRPRTLQLVCVAQVDLRNAMGEAWEIRDDNENRKSSEFQSSEFQSSEFQYRPQPNYPWID